MDQNLPYSMGDIGKGFGTSTPLRGGPFALTSNIPLGYNLPPPPKVKTREYPSADQHRGSNEEETEESDGSTPHGARNLVPRGYGLNNVWPSEEPVERRSGPRIIKEPGLYYKGKHFEKFLMQ